MAALARAGAVVVDWTPQAWVSVQVDNLVSTGVPKVNWSGALGTVVPLGVVTVTSTVPVPAGEVAVTEVAESAVMVPGLPGPKSTAVALPRLSPVTVTLVPPPDRAAGRAERRPVWVAGPRAA